MCARPDRNPDRDGDHDAAASASPGPLDLPAHALRTLLSTPFGDAPRAHRGRAFGVDYQCLDLPDGSTLYVTAHGWPLLDHLMPGRWYEHRLFADQGERLSGGTGNVYRVPTRGLAGRPRDLVVKFSRFAQEVPLHVMSTFLHAVDQAARDNAAFNSPFEEFGHIAALRQRSRQTALGRVWTKRPLAIYRPAGRFPLWQLGRTTGRFAAYDYAHGRNQDFEQRTHSPARAITLEIDRDYILLFGWVDGADAEQMFERNLLSIDDLKAMTQRVETHLAAAGFRVLDHKPKHFILRQRPDGSLLRRRDALAYALIDFELLQATQP